MSTDPTSLLLSYDEKIILSVKTCRKQFHSNVIPTQYYTYDSNIISPIRTTTKLLCVLILFLTLFIVLLSSILWIIFTTNLPMSDFDIEQTTMSTESSTESIISTQMSTNDITLMTSVLDNNTQTTYSTTELIHEEPTRKVLFIVADGIPADVIENVSIVHVKRIQDVGAYTRAYVGGEKRMYTETPTISSPGYMSLLTGTWGNKHNVYNNYVRNPNYHYKNIFRLLKEQQPEKKIGIFSTWVKNREKLIGEGLVEAGNITFDYKFDGYELDRITYPRDKYARHIFHIDERVTNETTKCIRTDAPDLSWVYLEYTDDMGHFYGDSEPFIRSVLNVDRQIGRIWEAIEYRMKYFNEEWLLLITTDHGRDAKTGREHSRQSIRERTTWIVSNQKEMNRYFYDFQPGIVDILPTIARFLNLTIPIESERELDGIPLIGNVSLTNPVIQLNESALNISWTMLNNIGNVSIWISEKNLFKQGLTDNYTLISTVPIDQQMINIDIGNYSSYFYKIVLEGQFNSVNKWIFRPWYRNRTIS